MAETSKVPYMAAYGNITKVLNKIKTASVPDRFTQDFLSAKLGLSGGSPKAVIPFLKRAGFLNSDGSPTERYRQFRNESVSGLAGAAALKQAYDSLYEMNEYVHALGDKEIKGLIVQATGVEPESSTTKSIIGSFKALRDFADFDGISDDGKIDTEIDKGSEDENKREDGDRAAVGNVRLGYTINLNLPATSDIAVFNSIFKSLREHLLG